MQRNTHLWPLVLGILVGSSLWGCTSLRTIRPDGLKHVRLGQAMPGPGNLQWKAGPYRDTLLNEGGYQWPAKILEYPNGEVWIEGDFFGADRVNRIRVESPDLHLKGRKQLAVGTPLAELRARHQRWQVSYLPGYARYDLIDPQQPNVHFLFAAPATVPDQPALDDLADTATVEAIVVM